MVKITFISSIIFIYIILVLMSRFYFSEVWEKTSIIVKEDDFSWNWKLNNDTKKIGNFNCQKATIKFRGRNYTAWFTNEIPVRYGPWKFQGLSGLILEVYDDDFFLHIITNIFAILVYNLMYIL